MGISSIVGRYSGSNGNSCIDVAVSRLKDPVRQFLDLTRYISNILSIYSAMLALDDKSIDGKGD